MVEREIPSAFIWRRIHSLFGIFLVGFLIFHLVTNSQAALFIGDDGEGFIHHVNQIHSLPYLPVIEIGVLGLFFAVHAIWGVRYLFTAQPNSGRGNGSEVSLGDLPRNRAYTWQRITSWLLLFAIAAHVVHMRIIRYPEMIRLGAEKQYIVQVSMDRGLYTLSERLGVDLFDSERITALRLGLPAVKEKIKKGEAGPASLKGIAAPLSIESYSQDRGDGLRHNAQLYENRKAVESLEKMEIQNGHVAAVTSSFGTAVLLTVRDCFKYPLAIILYTLFIPIATFHAFNGLWTSFITWGITLTERSQKTAKKLCLFLMGITTLLGWVAVWGTYWINLRY